MDARTGSRDLSVLVSMGSNIDPAVNLERALDLLATATEVTRVSRVFETDPVGGTMPAFLNAALELETDLEAAALKYEILRLIEARLGRRRTEDRNAPRTIDLDVALFGESVIVDADLDLRIPDPDIVRHPHVALPLADLAPDRRHPETGQTMAAIAAGFGSAVGVRVAANGMALIERLARMRAH